MIMVFRDVRAVFYETLYALKPYMKHAKHIYNLAPKMYSCV